MGNEVKQRICRDGFASVSEAQKFLGMCRTSIYKLMDSGTLPFAKFGKSRRVPWVALREYAEAQLIQRTA